MASINVSVSIEKPVKQTRFHPDPIKNKSRADLQHVQMSHRITSIQDNNYMFPCYIQWGPSLTGIRTTGHWKH